MPVMNGLDASKIIMKMIKNNQIKPLDILALTANIGTAEEEICNAAGINYYATKPITFNNFSKKIHDILKNRDRDKIHI